MAKFHGKIGYSILNNDNYGVYTNSFIEKDAVGDWNTHRVRVKSTNGVNDDFTLVNTLSIISNPFAMANLFNIKYAVYKGIKWKVTDIEEHYPRIILTIGDRYNG